MHVFRSTNKQKLSFKFFILKEKLKNKVYENKSSSFMVLKCLNNTADVFVLKLYSN